MNAPESPADEYERRLAERRAWAMILIARSGWAVAIAVLPILPVALFRHPLGRWLWELDDTSRRLAIGAGAAVLSVACLAPASLAAVTTVRHWSVLPREWKVLGLFSWVIAMIVAPVVIALLVMVMR